MSKLVCAVLSLTACLRLGAEVIDLNGEPHTLDPATELSAELPTACTIHVADGGKIDVAAGTLVRVKELWFGDRRICGTYTAADYPDYITGEGAVRGAGSGCVVIFR